ncbi:putative membrane protein [Clostridium argentinense CDC 2741]|uniref:Putative membrane protein n=1 Tax=Clostridium argentinense CDC 2741 TaxID=1418104 RepID=A0A0C1QVL9_9CLOT|nr:hypothetical protein [Clostridium argentinense]ARC84247.1 hypothetical protein RSJ17_06715 [Clostridium argentinense]KIE45012.1 putative membrane protein [Clostridium argentinense CDC 2741]NFF38205.1 hypothetical protein [Clostridium argentinense]NFP49210.1 hypothetical protein [Clostridium argentinense]NFP71510.1 hypothetical protein [Clostridium argentinense]
MKNNYKVISIIQWTFNIITVILAILYFLHFVEKNIAFLFLGVSNIINGVDRINITKRTDLKENKNYYKITGISWIILGVVFTFLSVSELLN